MADDKAGSMLQELFSVISPYEYSDYINYIIPRDCMMLNNFQKSDLSKDYWVDTKICYDRDVVQEDMLFELFGRFSNDDTLTVRANMLVEVKQYRDWYESAAYIMNIMKSTDMDTWLNIMKYEGIKGDEISLHALARIYQRHVIIHTKSRPWMTIKLNETITESRLSEVCNIHLLYMGNHVYAELVLKAKDMGAVLTCPKTTPAPITPLKTIGSLSTQSGTTGTNIDMISTGGLLSAFTFI